MGEGPITSKLRMSLWVSNQIPSWRDAMLNIDTSCFGLWKDKYSLSTLDSWFMHPPDSYMTEADFSALITITTKSSNTSIVLLIKMFLWDRYVWHYMPALVITHQLNGFIFHQMGQKPKLDPLGKITWGGVFSSDDAIWTSSGGEVWQTLQPV